MDVSVRIAARSPLTAASVLTHKTSTEHPVTFKRLQREESASYDRATLDYIHRASNTGLYEIRGLGAKRKLPHFDDLVFLGATGYDIAIESIGLLVRTPVSEPAILGILGVGLLALGLRRR